MKILFEPVSIIELSSDQLNLEGNDMFRICKIMQGQQHGFSEVNSIRVFPAKHHVVSGDRLEQACLAIEDELADRVKELKNANYVEAAERLQQRVTNDLYMMRETGFCSGGENYSRHLAGRKAGVPPDTLLDYFSFGLNGGARDWMLVIDESHVTLPQLSAMYLGDQERKRNLVKHGYRLPSALDNRPLKEEEFWQRVQQTVFVSATPSKRELSWTAEPPVEMVIRPTYVCGPELGNLKI
jgi:excinuclease ABC subunit B